MSILRNRGDYMTKMDWNEPSKAESKMKIETCGYCNQPPVVQDTPGTEVKAYMCLTSCKKCPQGHYSYLPIQCWNPMQKDIRARLAAAKKQGALEFADRAIKNIESRRLDAPIMDEPGEPSLHDEIWSIEIDFLKQLRAEIEGGK